MSDGVLYKSGAAWSKTIAKKSNGTGTDMSFSTVKHSNGSSWFSNYPMEQFYEKYFNVQWTHAYTKAGEKAYEPTWGDHPRCGDTAAGFVGLWGFDNAAMKAFVAGGKVTDIQIEVLFDDPSHNGNPYVYFYPHVYTSKPAKFDGWYANLSYKSNSQFNQTGGDYTRWITLPDEAWLNGGMAGICVGAEATAANSARFAGKTTSHSLNAFNTRLWIGVIK